MGAGGPPGQPLPFDPYLRQRLSAAVFQNLSKPQIDVLIAGCGTGQHAIETAQRFVGANVLAVDLSLASLAYAKRKTVELGRSNLEYGQADILKLGSLARSSSSPNRRGCCIMSPTLSPDGAWGSRCRGRGAS